MYIRPSATRCWPVPLAVALRPDLRQSSNDGDAVDLLPGLTVPMLATILALGSLIGTYAQGVPYTTALFATLFAIALFLLAINWLWTPLAGFSGFGQIWERYLLNIGTPFEHWLEPARANLRAKRFPGAIPVIRVEAIS